MSYRVWTQAGASTGVVGKVVWQATASMSLRASAKLGTMGVEVELGGSHRVSEFSTAGCSVVAGLQVPPSPLLRCTSVEQARAGMMWWPFTGLEDEWRRMCAGGGMFNAAFAK